MPLTSMFLFSASVQNKLHIKSQNKIWKTRSTLRKPFSTEYRSNVYSYGSYQTVTGSGIKQHDRPGRVNILWNTSKEQQALTKVQGTSTITHCRASHSLCTTINNIQLTCQKHTYIPYILSVHSLNSSTIQLLKATYALLGYFIFRWNQSLKPQSKTKSRV